MSALSPGLYRATVRGVADMIVLVDENNMGHLGTWGNENSCHAPSDNIHDARPLIVLDLKNPTAVVAALRRTGPANPYEFDGDDRLAFDLADQIEAQTKPPKPAEPTDLGALVIASQVGECDGSERTWVRFNHARTDCWIDTLSHIRSWADLEGVTS